MKKSVFMLLIILLIGLSLTCANNPTVKHAGDLTETDGIKIGDFVDGKGTLVWRDEFEGDTLDTTKWNYETGVGIHYDASLWGWGNNERQYYTKDNTRVENGMLIIEAEKHASTPGAANYFSSRLTTAGVKDAVTGKVTREKFVTPKTGYVEIRVKSPRGAGFWPGFCLLGANCFGYSGFKKVFWPTCGEIDIFEANGAKLTSIAPAVHHGVSFPGRYWVKYKETTVEDMSENYHVYGAGWDRSGIHFYINGENAFSVPLPFPEEHEGGNSAAFYDGPGFGMIIWFAVGGNFLAGTVPDDSVFTSDDWEARSLMVDWVRVYK